MVILPTSIPNCRASILALRAQARHILDEYNQLKRQRKEFELHDIPRGKHRARKCCKAITNLKPKIDYLNYERLQPALERYAKLLCLDICQKAVAKLPQELLDEVYSYLTDSSTIEVYEIERHCDPNVMCHLHEYQELPHLGPNQSLHFWKPEYVGTTFLRGLATTWFRTSVLDITDSSPQFLQTFVQQDLTTVSTANKATGTNILRNLKAMKDMKARDASIFIELLYQPFMVFSRETWDRVRKNFVRHVIDHVLPAVKDIQAGGIKVRVELYSEWDKGDIPLELTFSGSIEEMKKFIEI
ncbi:hypothetical protein BDV96DRAFT_644870 [Lophiotrema nucula]|uniref:Uncharacterized protein n=1 Tax=Lophiotrema nucula TaxID=690887 RepID=A0A6A5ZDC8_9PLEO|nr:hypothetical protein BDV96DRAFT_644870 [Lophiotrema nucula]